MAGHREQQRVLSGRVRTRIDLVAGWLAAALAAAGLALWAGLGEDRGLGPAASPDEPAAAAPASSASRAEPPRASAQVEAEQVRRALDMVGEIYAARGLPGLVAFSNSCPATVRGDPRVLDFCLAFNHYAGALMAGRGDAAAGAWQADAGGRDLALARTALPPAADPAARVAAVRRLAGEISLEAEAQRAAAPPAKRRAQPTRQAARPTAAAARQAKVARRPPAARPCRFRSTPADRVVCASPALRAADRRMNAAYRRVLARGAGPHALAREQTRWRVAVNAAAPDRAAVARLYRTRTRELEAKAAGRR